MLALPRRRFTRGSLEKEQRLPGVSGSRFWGVAGGEICPLLFNARRTPRVFATRQRYRLTSAHVVRVTVTWDVGGTETWPDCGTDVGNHGGPKLLAKRRS